MLSGPLAFAKIRILTAPYLARLYFILNDEYLTPRTCSCAR
jgi:hypothetical protein